MKRLLVLSVAAAVLLLALATAAMADESYWVAKIRAGWSDGTSSGTAIIGARPDPSNGSPITPQSSLANLAVGSTFSGAQFLDSDNPPPYQFVLTLVVGPGFSEHVGDPHQGMVWINGWTPEKYLSTSGRALPTNYRVKVGNVAGGAQYATWTYQDLYVGTQEPGMTGTGPVGFWYDYVTHADSFATSNDKFYVTVYAVPEPDCIASLAGLLGLASLALRKRRA